MTAIVHVGDCLDILRTFAPDSIDAIVTDPPAGISFMGKTWDHDKGGRNDWIAWMRARAAECLRVAKPGAHALVWSLPRTSHWTATAWEDGGWTVRDRLAHLFATGFPKSLGLPGGWGTALKPAVEDWWLLRKPFDGTVAANVLKHGTGGINVDGCRIEGTIESGWSKTGSKAGVNLAMSGPNTQMNPIPDSIIGRWPANLIHDGSAEVVAMFPESDGQNGFVTGEEPSALTNDVYGDFKGRPASDPRGNSGSASRFYFAGKATRADREEGLSAFLPKQRDECREADAPGANNPRNRGGQGRANYHPTVKATSLMRWLCKLITPVGGTVLDPFAGSGSTGKACALERFGFVGIEQDEEFADIARARIAWAEAHREPEQLSLLGEEIAKVDDHPSKRDNAQKTEAP